MPKENLQILVTGGAGYIGSHVALEFLSRTDSKIVIIDNLSTGFLDNVSALQSAYGERVSFMRLDLGDKEGLRRLFEAHDFDLILHFAASLSVFESVQRPIDYFQNNVANSIALINTAISAGVKNFIFSSTAAVYGDVVSQEPILESSALNPINPYGASKMMVERILSDAASVHDFNFVALRYFNVAGASEFLGQRGKQATHLIKVAMQCAAGVRDSMDIYGVDYPTKDGSCVRDYIHVKDLASAHFSAHEFLRDRGGSQIFNAGYTDGYSVLEVISEVKNITGVDFKAHIRPRREGDPARLIADNSKLLSLTNWKPKENLESIIKSAYAFELALKQSFTLR